VAERSGAALIKYGQIRQRSAGTQVQGACRGTGDGHAAAQRNLFGRLLGCLHRCLTTGQHYDETIAFPDATKQSRRAA
jgi:hypothetical protein